MAGTYLFIGPGGSIYWSDPVADFASLPASAPEGTVRVTLDTGSIYYFDGAAWQPLGGADFIQSIVDTNALDLTVSANALSADLRISANAATAGFFKATTTVKSTGSVGLHVEAPEATGSQTGFITSTDWTTFNNKVSTSRAINTTAPLTGGGDLSADRTIAMPVATALADGYLSASAFNTFNNKVPSTRAVNTTSPLSGGGPLSVDRTLSISQSTTSTDGYLSSTDWNTFNNKEPAITAGTTAQYWRGDKSFQTLQMSALTAITDGSAAASGKIGEILSATQATATGTGVGGTGAYGNATSVSLTAGVWAISGVAAFKENGAVLTTSVTAGISASATGSGIGAFDIAINPNTYTAGEDIQFPTPTVYVSIGSTTTYYLNTRFYYTSGSPQHYGKIQAIRIR